MRYMNNSNISANDVVLRELIEADLPTIFEQQLDPDANYMAAFTSRDPAYRTAFDAHWAKILKDDTIFKRTILFQGQIAGQLGCWQQSGERELGYWIGKQYWGKGIATKALSLFLLEFTVRPIYARAVKDNVGSIRVLQKCGFTISGEDKGFANARSKEVEEFIFKLP